MDTFFGLAAVLITTLVALFAALALQGLLLRATLALMQPATAARQITPPAMERGTQLVVQPYAKAR